MSHMPLCDGAVGAGDAGAVEHEGDAGPVQRAVHQQLVEGPVEERGVDRDDRVQPADTRGPAAIVTACCSAMPTSKTRSG